MNRHRRHVLGLIKPITAEALRLVEDEPAGVCEIRVYHEPQQLVEVARRAHANMRSPDAGPWLPWGDEDSATPGIDPKRLEGLVLDDTMAQRIGAWIHSTWSDHYVGEGYLHDGNDDKGLKTLRFRPKIRKSGRYEIRLAYVACTNRASDVSVIVKTSSTAQTVRLDQKKKAPVDGLFISLGVFALVAGEEAVIEISNADTDGYVVVDCLQLLPQF